MLNWRKSTQSRKNLSSEDGDGDDENNLKDGDIILDEEKKTVMLFSSKFKSKPHQTNNRDSSSAWGDEQGGKADNSNLQESRGRDSRMSVTVSEQDTPSTTENIMSGRDN